ncbi:hypothetical protein PP707_03590 [Acetobacter pasteurianus]|nr:hypothetical protein [Acetobacter pasteurianus]
MYIYFVGEACSQICPYTSPVSTGWATAMEKEEEEEEKVLVA